MGRRGPKAGFNRPQKIKKTVGKRGRQKTFSKEDVDRIIAELLSDDVDLNKWSTPNGAAPKREMCITLKVTGKQYHVIKYVCHKWGVSLMYMLKKLIVRQYFKESGWLKEISREIPGEVMEYLFDFAYAKTTSRQQRIYKARTI